MLLCGQCWNYMLFGLNWKNPMVNSRKYEFWWLFLVIVYIFWLELISILKLLLVGVMMIIFFGLIFNRMMLHSNPYLRWLYVCVHISFPVDGCTLSSQLSFFIRKFWTRKYRNIKNKNNNYNNNRKRILTWLNHRFWPSVCFVHNNSNTNEYYFWTMLELYAFWPQLEAAIGKLWVLGTCSHWRVYIFGLNWSLFLNYCLLRLWWSFSLG